MLPVFPVYVLSTCVSKSVHAGALPGPTYPYFQNHRSTEAHTVSWIPGPWVVRTSSVFGDSQAMILDGHDTGMMIPHLSPIMDNALLPVTLLTSSCTFPFVSSTQKCRGKGIAGFFPAYAPFVYCDSEATTKKATKSEPKPKPPSSSDELQAAAGRKNKVLKGGLARPGMRTGLDEKLQGEIKVRDKTFAFKLKLSGQGRICIPVSATVFMRLSFSDLLSGWVKVLFTRSLDALVGALLRPVMAGKKNLLAARFDNDVARAFGAQSLTRGIKNEADRQMQRGVARLACKEIWASVAVDTAYKAMYDGILKAMVLEFKIKMPFGLFSYSFADAKGKLVYWPFDGIPTPIEFKGLRTAATAMLKDLSYHPSVNGMVIQNPNYAAAPREAELPPVETNAPAEIQTAPEQPASSEPKGGYWADPSQPDEQADDGPEDYWTDPSQLDKWPGT